MDQGNEGFKYEEEYITNPKGLKLFTCRWLPEHRKPKALVFLCHGYAVECSITMRGTGTRLAKAGYAVHGIDYQGHGKSSGLQAYIPSFHDLVNDVDIHFRSICERAENLHKHRFLLGESMGGSVAILLNRKDPKYWDGAVLVAPMCKIADDMKPPLIVIIISKILVKIIPTWKITPTKDIIDLAIKDPKVRMEFRSNPYCYKEKPRIKTADELYKVSLDIEKNLHQVSMPFLIVHGEEDVVTDPSTSKLLHESASSRDKTLKLYPGMWHALTCGEPPENIELVFSDIVAWLDESLSRIPTRMEMELKMTHDNPFAATTNKVETVRRTSPCFD